jgi:hypothetical protein
MLPNSKIKLSITKEKLKIGVLKQITFKKKFWDKTFRLTAKIKK